MKLYYSKGACSLAVRILAHELGLSLDYEAVDLKTKKTETGQDFLSINPKGSVPVLGLDKGETLTENAAIQQYLADTQHAFQLLPEVGNLFRYHVIEWLNFVGTDLHKNFSALFNNQIPEEIKKSVFIPIIKHKLDFVEATLNKQAYVTGSSITLPDIYLFVILRWLTHFKLNISDWPNLSNYFLKIKERAAVQTALKEEGLSAS